MVVYVITPAPVLDRLVNAIVNCRPRYTNNVIDFAEWRRRLKGE